MWSLGVACPPAQGYFAAHTLSLKACSGQQPLAQQQQLVQAQLQQEELDRANQLALRIIRETEASHAHGSSGAHQFKSHTQEGALASALLVLSFLTRLSVANSGQAEAAADSNAHSNNNLISV